MKPKNGLVDNISYYFKIQYELFKSKQEEETWKMYVLKVLQEYYSLFCNARNFPQ